MMFKKGETCESDAVTAISPDLNHDATAVKAFLQYLDTPISIHHPNHQAPHLCNTWLALSSIL